MSKQKEINFRAVKAKTQGGWTLCLFETLEQAKNWISPCDHYAIFDVKGNKKKLVESKNWDVEADAAIWELPQAEIIKMEKVKFNGERN